ncbi:MAG: LysM peptidoglycan-binding domain-containing protein [Lentimonas sp.]
MKVSKVLGFVLSLHAVIITVLITLPGCQTSQPPTQVFKQERTTSDLIDITREDESSSLDAAFNAGIEGDTDFGEFSDIPAVDPIAPEVSVGPSVDVAGPSFETYTIVKGDSLWKVSRKFKVSLNQLYAANALNKDSVLSIGQQIQIPTEGGSATVSTVTPDTYQPSSFNTGSQSYTVKSGDTLSKIAVQYGTTVRVIKAANSKISDMIRVGETLIIPEAGSTGGSSSSSTVAPAPTASVTTAVPAVSSGTGTHTVQAGEYPEGIARKYGMTSSELLALNGITDPRKLQIGQVLNVRGSESASKVDSKIETVTTIGATPIPATIAQAPERVSIDGPVETAVVSAGSLIESETDVIDVDSEFEGLVEVPVIRLEE